MNLYHCSLSSQQRSVNGDPKRPTENWNDFVGFPDSKSPSFHRVSRSFQWESRGHCFTWDYVLMPTLFVNTGNFIMPRHRDMSMLISYYLYRVQPMQGAQLSPKTWFPALIHHCRYYVNHQSSSTKCMGVDPTVPVRPLHIRQLANFFHWWDIIVWGTLLPLTWRIKYQAYTPLFFYRH